MLAIRAEGAHHAAIEARSMIDGAVALGGYAYAVCHVLLRWPRFPWIAVTALLPLWGMVAALLWSVWLQ
jgi:hypothetical protein